MGSQDLASGLSLERDGCWRGTELVFDGSGKLIRENQIGTSKMMESVEREGRLWIDLNVQFWRS